MVALDISHSRPRPLARTQEGGGGQPSVQGKARAATRRGPAGGPVVPQSVRGRFRRIKWTTLALALAVFGLLPFLRWDRGPGEPDQAFLFDLVKGRLYLLGVGLWPQELYYLTGALVLASLVLILLNAVAGRVWCGFLCPQTVWTDLFLAVERLVEGDRREQLKKRGAPLSVRRAAELGVKHAAWLAIAAWTGASAVFYFVDAPTALREMVSGQASVLIYSWVGIGAALTYMLAGFAREQVCTWMCPWPRLQGAIWDPEALTVNYRDYRGEPRGSAKKAVELRAAGEKAGDCVDCLQCVVVCPIGIDIRQGPNFACINCGLCVDACDTVMVKLDRPTGLIAYESWTNIERGRRGEAPRRRVLRPKTIGLAAAAVALAGGMGVVLSGRSMGGLTVQHERNPMAVRLSDGRTRNVYTLRIANKTGAERRYAVEAEGLPGLQLAMVGPAEVVVGPDATAEARVTLTAPAREEGAVRFVVRADEQSYSAQDVFVGATMPQ
ncbi:cytochrome c oxidase accessory protein CcoG [Alsobacter sp. SYSU M60028]|uniref:Cytochrome c oxidase accessory protein CcoG n=1 Tax=Alsobacter ponti TaxID=2962936 RepID=A0ABT1LCS5_9HYPH|nr:cytochrome c oxidase accessory protein CcoG [Alsobacter ponti]MCP8938058.1 cytochrome c oxidase accessory protein CcoG [Alsobacter ponti]